MRKAAPRLLVGLLVAIVLLLRLDFWWPDEAALALGLPVSLLYHTLYCLGAAGLAWLLGRHAIPEPAAGKAGEKSGEQR